MKPKQTLQLSLASLAMMIFTISEVRAGPWVEAGDKRLRHHLTVLADAGVLNVPITTWPLSWGAVMEQLSPVRAEQLDWSLEYLNFSFGQAQQSAQSKHFLSWQSDPTVIADFGLNRREEQELGGEIDWVGYQLALKLRGSWVPNASDGGESRLDGSYFAGLVGNWVLGVGAIDRWWGPGWQSSLILSNNARPVPALMLQRIYADPFALPLLHHLGPWTFTGFVGQLESARTVSDAKLVGARFSFKPAQALEVALSRTAQWGGERRPENLSSFWDLMLGNDNVGDNGIDADNQPGNQLGSIDVRWGGMPLGQPSAIYIQAVGEDESNGLPSKTLHLVGAETAWLTNDLQSRFMLEYSDTSVSSGARFNTAYEHSLYQSGYRYKGRPMAASFDNDTEALTFKADHYFANGDAFSWSVSRLNLNRDGAQVGYTDGGSVFGQAATSVDYLALEFSRSWARWQLAVGAHHFSEPVSVYGTTVSGLGFSINIDFRP